MGKKLKGIKYESGDVVMHKLGITLVVAEVLLNDSVEGVYIHEGYRCRYRVEDDLKEIFVTDHELLPKPVKSSPTPLTH